MTAIGNVTARQAFSFGTGKTWSAVAPITTAEQTTTVRGLKTGDVLHVSKPTAQAGLGVVGSRVSTDDTLAIVFTNPTAATITPTAKEMWLAVVEKAIQPVQSDATI